RISAVTGSTRTEYVYDGRGSVAAAISYNDSWYTVGGGLARKHVTSKSYAPFGEQIGEAASGFGHNSEYYNAATGMIYLRARFYEPELNRFSQKDTLRGSITDGISLDRYLYCQSDPVNFADYNGLQMVAVGLEGGGGSGKTAKQPAIIDSVTPSISSAASAASIVNNAVPKQGKPKYNHI
ncbi:MAG: RHS repeat-associated core domain-containing protein, partial [Oscillospiraceae bacterium]|nr:RHS repeat-associated core domain-containing protein [Oscillospiraceae bacterium]